MAATIPGEGRIRLGIRTQTQGSSWRLRLFKNDITPGVSSALADFTEANFSGYSEGTPSWGSFALNGSNAAESVASQISYSHNGGGTSNTIYGWYLVEIDGTLGNKVLAAERFANPITMAASGDVIRITPTETLTQA